MALTRCAAQAEMVGGVLWGKLADVIDYRYCMTVRGAQNRRCTDRSSQIGLAFYFAALGVTVLYKLDLPMVIAAAFSTLFSSSSIFVDRCLAVGRRTSLFAVHHRRWLWPGRRLAQRQLLCHNAR